MALDRLGWGPQLGEPSNKQSFLMEGKLRPRNLRILTVAFAGAMVVGGNAYADTFRIGLLTDMSGSLADTSGAGTEASMRMAVEDYGGRIFGKEIEIVTADHLNKPDVGIAKAREWYDNGVAAIFDIGLTSIAIGVQELAAEKNKIAMFLSTASSDLTRTYCGPNGIHWTYDTFSYAKGAVTAAHQSGARDWYFLTIDYAYGENLQAEASQVISSLSGSVLGAAKHPFEAFDHSSAILMAQSSGADTVALATLTPHMVSIIKQMDEFGLKGKLRAAPLALMLHDVKALGLAQAQGLAVTAPYYWDDNDETREFATRYHERFGKMPNEIQASAYGAVIHYLNALDAAGTEDASIVIQRMKQTPINDFMTDGGRIRSDGRAIRTMNLYRVKSPGASKSEWDLLEKIGEIPAEEAFLPELPGDCGLAEPMKAN